MRMKALLPVQTENGLSTLLVNAARGHIMEQRLVSLPEVQNKATWTINDNKEPYGMHHDVKHQCTSNMHHEERLPLR